MLNFNRRDRSAEPTDAAKSVLKPAIYDPPGAAAPGAAVVPRGAPAPQAHTAESSSAARVGAAAVPMPAPAASPARAPAPVGDGQESKLFVGINIKLKGVEISDCDVLVIEGLVEATVHSKAMEIAKPGSLSGNAQIDVAEVHGEFVGELTARTRLVVHGTGRVSGTIRYGSLIVAEGGEVTGDVKRLDAAPAETITATTQVPAATSPARAPLSPSSERWSN
jgi:cytoskeletal protein CcmA (bactofilin family)